MLTDAEQIKHYPPHAQYYLGEAYRQERDVGVRLEIVGSLGEVRERAGLSYLEEAMRDGNPTVRIRATQVYGRVLGLQ